MSGRSDVGFRSGGCPSAGPARRRRGLRSRNRHGGSGVGKLAAAEEARQQLPIGGVASVSGAMVIGRSAAGAGAGAAAAGAAACTFLPRASRDCRAKSRTPSTAIAIRLSMIRLGIIVFPPRTAGLSRGLSRPARRQYAPRGNSMRNVVPRPVSDSNSMRPLCNCTKRNVLARPMPVPPGRVVKKSWNIFFWSSGGIPLPGILHGDHGEFAAAPRAELDSSAGSVNSHAFSSRFRTA